MAILSLPLGHFELTSTGVSSRDSYVWIRTQIALNLRSKDANVLIKNRRHFFFTQGDYIRLIELSQTFINSKSKIYSESTVSTTVEPFTFVPLELGFSFTCLDGEVDSNLDGEITIRIMLDYGLVNMEFSSNYVGGEFNVRAQDLLKFLKTLESELPS